MTGRHKLVLLILMTINIAICYTALFYLYGITRMGS